MGDFPKVWTRELATVAPLVPLFRKRRWSNTRSFGSHLRLFLSVRAGREGANGLLSFWRVRVTTELMDAKELRGPRGTGTKGALGKFALWTSLGGRHTIDSICSRLLLSRLWLPLPGEEEGIRMFLSSCCESLPLGPLLLDPSKLLSCRRPPKGATLPSEGGGPCWGRPLSGLGTSLEIRL